jgi:hypothetical protein
MAHCLVHIVSARHAAHDARSTRRVRGRVAVVAVVAAASCLLPSSTLAAGGVTSARGSTRSALIDAFAAQDGTSQGISGVYVSGSAGIVCQRTADAGLVRFLFRHAGRSWRFAFSSRRTGQGTTTQRRLERACH